MPGNIINLSPEDIARWPTPNYVDPYERKWMPEYAGVLYGVATLMVMLRLWLRALKYAGGLGVDDALLICSWICVSWFTVLAILDAEVYKTSRHIWDIPVNDFSSIALIAWMGELSFLLTGCFAKVSVLLFYRRLVQSTCHKYWIWAVIAAICFTVAYTLAFILALVFNCNPTEAYWESFNLNWHKEFTCANTQVINLLAGVTAVVSDLYAVALPCIMMRNLQLPRRQKVALNVVFSLALLVVAASGIRTYYLWKVGHSVDVSTAIWNVFVWSQLELTLGIMCACAPSLRALLRLWFTPTLTKITNSSRNRRQSDSEQQLSSVTAMEAHEDDEGDETRTELYRPDFGMKSSPVPRIDSLVTAEPHPPPINPKACHLPPLVKTPADYETYNLRTVEKSAQIYRDLRRESRRRSLEQARRYRERLKNYKEKSRCYGKLEGHEMETLSTRSRQNTVL